MTFGTPRDVSSGELGVEWEGQLWAELSGLEMRGREGNYVGCLTGLVLGFIGCVP